MHRDPRFADVERLIGFLTASQGLGMAAGKWLDWPSLLLASFAKYGIDWGWVWLYVLFGSALLGASTLTTISLRIFALIASALLWLATGLASIYLHLPVAVLFAMVLVYYCLRSARSIYVGR